MEGTGPVVAPQASQQFFELSTGFHFDAGAGESNSRNPHFSEKPFRIAW
jgi:hypothetical protein